MPFNVSGLHVHWRAFRARNPQWELQIRLSNYLEPFSHLRNGDFDVFVAWLPVEEPDLTVGPALLVDQRIIAVSETHPLAARTSVPLEMFADFPFGIGDPKLDYWEDSYLPFQTRSGRTIERGMHASNGNELMTAVGMGEIIMAFPSHVTEYWAVPDVRWLPVPDLPPLTYVLTWRTEAENDMIRALAATVRDIGPIDL